jgi:FliI/YscN family ATPase
MPADLVLDHIKRRLNDVRPVQLYGRVRRTIGNLVESDGPPVATGRLCRIETSAGPLVCESQGFRDGATLLFPFGRPTGILPGSVVTASGEALRLGVGPGLVGRILDGLGHPLDGRGPVQVETTVSLENDAPLALDRSRITQALETRIRVIDGLLTCGRGQRVGLFAGSGVGKSVLLGMIARHGKADVNVVALIGERGREVKEFIERDLGPEGMARSVVIAVTSDQPPVMRIKGAEYATAIAEYFRAQGKDVALLFDSVTRVAMALREIGLAVGEPPTTKGYTPSMYSYLPRLLERAGTDAAGSITGFYTVLVEGDDLTDPVADTVRATLDGHLVLSRDLAGRNHFPAIDVLESTSRVMPDVVSVEHREAATRMREMLAAYRQNEDLINIGAYVKGSSLLTDLAIERQEETNKFLAQWIAEGSDFADTLRRLSALSAR